MFTHSIINLLIFKIKFYLNIKYNIIHNFNIFINKHNINIKTIFNYLQNIKKSVFNLRNKFNFNKSGRNLMPSKKKTGKSRLGSSSSNILKKGLPYVGLRNIKLKKNKHNKNLLKSIVSNKKGIIEMKTLEIIKFIHYLKIVRLKDTHNKIIDQDLANITSINQINDYINTLIKTGTINLFY